MKSNPSQSIRISNQSFRSFLLLIVLGLILMSCSDDKENGPDTRPLFVGEYEVEDISGSGYTYNYEISIVNGADKELNISNFADIFNVPVKGTVEGSSLTIKSQSFTNPSSGNTIEVSGSGSIDGDVLTFTYTTTGYIEYVGTCTATKK